ncbi:MAG: pantoate--beta-alanine ligase [Candidatus Omnitrophota bacterium]
MKIIRSIERMQRTAKELKRKGKSIGFVPTMGALHAGHLSLIKQARKENDVAVTSIFVNPAQFGPGEDYLRYPRDLKTDALLCKKEGVDIIFYPAAGRMYPEGYKTYVITESLSNVLCGRFRPGHFRGVATIVARLFNIVQPDAAYFGRKDAQQAVIIQQMARDLNMPIKIRVMPIIREADGLALSSRNAYLNARERKDAVVLCEALKKAEAMIIRGVAVSSKIKLAMRGIIRKKKTARIQYLEIVDPVELKPVKKIRDEALIALAVYIGRTRLIDNMII